MRLTRRGAIAGPPSLHERSVLWTQPLFPIDSDGSLFTAPDSRIGDVAPGRLSLVAHDVMAYALRAIHT